MTTARFAGIVHPRAGCWGFDDLLTVDVEGHALRLAVKHSAFNVEITCDDPEPGLSRLMSLWNVAETGVRAALDALGYHMGAALDIELVSGGIDGGVFLFDRLHEASLATSDDMRVSGERLSPYLTLAQENPYFRHALADLRSAIAYPADSAFYAFRAIESIRQHYVNILPPSSTKKRSWEALRNELGFSRDDFDELTEASTNNRHGAGSAMTPTERGRYIRLAREVVKRFVDADPRSQVDQPVLAAAD